MARTVKEWVGKTDDAMPPPMVRLRILIKYDRICQLSFTKIVGTFHLHHVIELADGGENRESNLVPVLPEPHRLATAKAASERARVRAKTMANHGIKRQTQKIPGRGFAKPPPQNRATGEIKKWKGY